jgi:hypothetical protein
VLFRIHVFLELDDVHAIDVSTRHHDLVENE